MCVIKLESPLSDPTSAGDDSELVLEELELFMRALLFSLLLDSNVDKRVAAFSLCNDPSDEPDKDCGTVFGFLA